MGHSKTDCREVLRQLFLFIDGEMAAGDCGSIESHLSRCAPCLHNVEFERDLKAFVRRKCSEGAAAPEIADRLRERLNQFRSEQA